MHIQRLWSSIHRIGAVFLVMFFGGLFLFQPRLEAQMPHPINSAAYPPAFPVSDVRLPNPIINQSSFEQFEPSSVVLNGYAYFKAYDLNYGSELWRTDGTKTGTILVQDINPGISDSIPSTLKKSGNYIFFITRDAQNQLELWRTNGSETVFLVELDVNTPIIDVDGRIFFKKSNALWISDGSVIGTHLVKEIAVNQPFLFNHYLLFRDQQNTLWASDGTPEGTMPLTNYPTTPMPVPQTILGNLTFFVGDTCELWRSETLTSGLELVKDFSINGSCNNGSISHLTVMSDTLFFIRNESIDQNQYLASLWRSDGTETGTVRISDPFSSVYPTPIRILLRGDNKLFFVHWNSIWKSDGTTEGTQLVKAINTTDSRYFTIVDDLLFFVADVRESSSGVNYEVWRTDGTDIGTFQVKDINPTNNPDLDNHDPFSLTALGPQLIFNADDSIHGRELWKSDGTEAGTTIIKDINAFQVFPQHAYYPWQYPSESIEMAAKGKLLFFSGSTPQSKGLWRTSGISETTTLVHQTPAPSIIYGLHAIQEQLFFLTAPDEYSYTTSTFWSNTGQISQTNLLGTLNPTETYRSSPITPQNINTIRQQNGKTIFNTYDYIWETNGITTTLIRRMNGTVDGLPFSVIGDMLTQFNGGLLFAGGIKQTCDKIYEYELWGSDINGMNPYLIKNINLSIGTIAHPPPTPVECIYGSSYPHSFVVNGDIAFFIASDDDLELWRTDGTPEGSFKLASVVSDSPITLINNYVYFIASDPIYGPELWKSDGTIAGTTLVKDMYPGVGGSSPQELILINNTLFFTALTPEYGRELWRTDGTAEGTSLVADIALGTASSNPTGIRAISGKLFFAAHNGQTGFEPWMSDGTAVGTQLLDDVISGEEGSDPFSWTQAGDYVYFTVKHGMERRLWAIELFDRRQIWIPLISR